VTSSGSEREGWTMHQQQASAVDEVQEEQAPQEGGKVIPLFRGQQDVEQPLVTLGNGSWKKRDVARRFAVSERTVERWQLLEGLPVEKPFGPRGPVRYCQAKVEAWWVAKCSNSSWAAGAGMVLLAFGKAFGL
jgi:hypothetical protein